MSRRKIITRVIVFLLLGAIVNVAMAWGCVLWASRTHSDEWAPAHSMQHWRDYWSANDLVRRFRLIVTDNPRETFAGQRRIRYARPSHAILQGRGVEQTAHACVIVDDAMAMRLGTGLEVRAGWPLFSITGTSIYDCTVPGEWKRAGTISIPCVGNEWERTGRGWRDLPLRPLWPGFAINTLFYAGILWVLFAAPFALRRRTRIKRGLCPACAYPVGDSTVCTECGKAVTPRRGAGV